MAQIQPIKRERDAFNKGDVFSDMHFERREKGN